MKLVQNGLYMYEESSKSKISQEEMDSFMKLFNISFHEKSMKVFKEMINKEFGILRRKRLKNNEFINFRCRKCEGCPHFLSCNKFKDSGTPDKSVITIKYNGENNKVKVNGKYLFVNPRMKMLLEYFTGYLTTVDERMSFEEHADRKKPSNKGGFGIF